MAIPTFKEAKERGFDFQYAKGWLTPGNIRNAMAQDASLVTSPNQELMW